MRASEMCAAEEMGFFLGVVVTRHSLSDVDWLHAAQAEINYAIVHR